MSVSPQALSLLVVYSDDLERASRFYRVLGLDLVAEQHGKGPRHFSCQVGPTLFELYPAGERQTSGTLRFGLAVSDVDSVVSIAAEHGGSIVTAAVDSPWGRRAVVADPDGNRVELNQAVSHSEERKFHAT